MVTHLMELQIGYTYLYYTSLFHYITQKLTFLAGHFDVAAGEVTEPSLSMVQALTALVGPNSSFSGKPVEIVGNAVKAPELPGPRLEGIRSDWMAPHESAPIHTL